MFRSYLLNWGQLAMSRGWYYKPLLNQVIFCRISIPPIAGINPTKHPWPPVLFNIIESGPTTHVSKIES